MKLEGWDNFDIDDFDLDEIPFPIKSNTYDYVYMRMVIEHLLYPDRTIRECRRILKDGGILRIDTADYTNKSAYNCLEHKTFLCQEAFEYFARDNKGFKVKTCYTTPTWIGRFFPKYLRNKLSLFINGLKAQIIVEYKIKK